MAISLNNSGCFSICLPIQKKVALALCLSRRSKIDFVYCGWGPSSKVIAIFFVFNNCFDENELMKINNFNLLIKNIPLFAVRSSDRKKVKVSYANMRDTFNDFGHIKKLEIFKGNAYLGFKTGKEASETHKLINNMQLGENIIKTKVI